MRYSAVQTFLRFQYDDAPISGLYSAEDIWVAPVLVVLMAVLNPNTL
jgi:hypothetical protein